MPGHEVEFVTPLPQRGKLAVALPAVPGHRSDARRSLGRRICHELRSAKLASAKGSKLANRSSYESLETLAIGRPAITRYALNDGQL